MHYSVRCGHRGLRPMPIVARLCLLLTLSSQLISPYLLLHIHISKASNLLTVWVNVHVSARGCNKNYKQETQLSLTNCGTRLEISTFKKYHDLQTGVMGHWRSLEMSPFDTAHVTSYWCSIVTRALSSVVSDIFNVEKCHDLDIRVRGHSRSLKVVPFDRLVFPIKCSILTFVS